MSPQRRLKSLGETIQFGTHPTRLAALISIKLQLYKKWFIQIASAHNGAGGAGLRSKNKRFKVENNRVGISAFD